VVGGKRESVEILTAVRDFVQEEVSPVANKLEHADEYPKDLVRRMRDLGLFGVAISKEHGGLGLDLTTYALIIMELSRGWMSFAGILNSHFVSAWMIDRFGTEEQKQRYLPRMARGDIRAAISMTEPHAGSDLQAIKTHAVRHGNEYTVQGEKMWCTNGLRAAIVMLLAKTDLRAVPRHKGMTTFIIEKKPNIFQQPGLTIPPLLEKLGYRGIEGTRLLFEGFRTPASSVLGGEEGWGFKQFMAGIELGRINVAARAVGLATASFEAAIDHARRREAFGRPIAQHQAVQLKLADMATRIRASRLLTLEAARKKDAGERADLDAGMAKLFATETAQAAALESMRIHGGVSYLQDLDVERYYRDAPVLIIGEGSNEIQRLVIARRLLEMTDASDY
jgi:alkylation response protein AidB-like acyl-CoA dehydrogenase